MGAKTKGLVEGPSVYLLAGNGAAVKRQGPDEMKTISLPRNITELLDMEIIRGKTYEEKIEMLALGSFVSKLKECNEEIIEFETKYGMSFGEFEKAWDDDRIKDKHSHKVESDYIEWEAIELEKSRWLSVLRKIRRGFDNLKEWHQHPFGHPGNHVGCTEPAMDKIFEEVTGILREI